MITTQERQFQATDVTQAQIDQYRQNGFIQLDGVFAGWSLLYGSVVQ